MLLVVLLGMGSFLPLLLDDYWLHVAIIGLFYVIMVSSWNLLAGYTGQVSFAHAAFAGIGAYISGILSINLNIAPMITILIGSIVAAILGFGLGFLCLRMGGIYLSLTTLGFSEIVRLIITNEYEITRGTMGLEVPSLLGFYSKTFYYYIMFAVAILILIFLNKLIKSDLGLAFKSVLNDELAASSCGIDTIRVRIVAFTISSAIAGLAGGLYGHYLLLITPDICSLGQMFMVLAMTVIGGMGTLSGPVIGALFLQVLSEYIRVYGKIHLLLFGSIALLVARFAPGGIVGLFKTVFKNKNLLKSLKQTQ
ncbi:branched-chain amino acid ABC transporter permease [bacterium]|nr:branched-chain amino acid ABC transporter permease [bacterium]MBU4510811.1 branched-chain amino acid ABC transporter permease [bacterium]